MKKWPAFFLILLFSLILTPSAFTQTTVGQPKQDMLIVFDVSGSMNSLLEGQRMIDLAKQAISQAMAVIPPQAEVGLRVYAHRVDKSNRDASCKDTELLVPIGKGNGPTIASMVQMLQPKGWTPIAYSLEQAAGDFAGNKESLHTIVLVSDGEETCGGDPLAAARSLTQQGFKVVINTIGFNVEEIARQQLKSLAEQFGGTYSDVRSGAGLQLEIQKLAQQTFLIEKKQDKNQIRGGDSFATAVPIEIGKRYSLDHHQRINQFDYFVFNLKQGEAVAVRAFPVPICLEVAGLQIEEKPGKKWCYPEGFRFVLADGQKELQRLADDDVDHQHESEYFTSQAPGSTPHYLIVGSPSADMHKDHEFMLVTKQGQVNISAQEIGDANSGRDAGDNTSTAIPIAPGLYEVNSVTEPADLMDLFKIGIPSGNAVKIVLGGKKGSRDYHDVDIEIVGDLGEILAKGRFGEGKSLTYEVPAASTPKNVYIRVKLDEKDWADDQTLDYTLAYNLTPSHVSSEVPPSRTNHDISPTSAVEKPLGFQSWMIWALVAYVLFLALVLLFLWRWTKKQTTPVSVFGKILGFYQLIASVVGVGVGFYLLTELASFAVQIVLLTVLLLVGGMGLLAGAKLLAAKSLRLSFWWALLQLPWISLNLHWAEFGYRCGLLLSVPINFIVDFAGPYWFTFGFHPRLGLDLYLNSQFFYPGAGFSIGLGINLMAVVFLILLWFYQRKKKPAVTPNTEPSPTV